MPKRSSHPFVRPLATLAAAAALAMTSAAAHEHSPKDRKTAAILVFDGVQIIDSTGPYEVLGQGGFDVFTVAASKSPVTTSMGLTVVPARTFADAPRTDVLVIPGGDVGAAQKDAATLKWVREQSAAARHTLSVCNGAFILSAAGLLDGLSATTFYRLIDDLKKEAPRTKVVSDQRYVDNGRIITTAGLSSGIDGALHLLERMFGKGRAQAVALNMEYDWRPESGYARAALADRLIPDVGLESLGSWTIDSTAGTRDAWHLVVKGASDLTAAQLLDRIGAAFTERGGWSKPAEGARLPSRSDWAFRGPDGRPWSGVLSIRPAEGREREYTLSLDIARAS